MASRVFLLLSIQTSIQSRNFAIISGKCSLSRESVNWPSGTLTAAVDETIEVVVRIQLGGGGEKSDNDH